MNKFYMDLTYFIYILYGVYVLSIKLKFYIINTFFTAWKQNIFVINKYFDLCFFFLLFSFYSVFLDSDKFMELWKGRYL